MYANVLKFHIWIPHEKIGDLYFFFLVLISNISQKVFELKKYFVGVMARCNFWLFNLVAFMCIA